MKITAIDICAVLAALAASCAARDFSPEAYRHLPDWENPYITSSNRLPARAAFVPAHDEATARKIAFLQEPRNASQWVESLDGEWDFHWRAVPEPFDTDIPAKDAKITVPSCWQLQGEYDVPIYTNSRYPHVRNPPRIMEPDPPEDFTAYRMRNPVGTYRRTFSIPNAWQGRRITLRFDGVYSAFYVRINGVTAGYSEDSRLPAEFDITPFVAPTGQDNEIEVEVYRWCDGSYLEDQDFWRLSGIYRSVWLVAERMDGIRDITVDANVSDDLKTGKVEVKAEFAQNKPGLSVDSVKLYSPDGEEMPLALANPLLWDCDNPNLYTLVVGHKGDFYAFPVGFRKIAIEDGVLKINNRRVLIKGVNRHELSPTGGYTVTLDEMKKDVAAFKSLAINAVRTCHYPDLPDWYALCAINGIYVTCEANIESHGMGYGKETLAKRPDFLKAHIERDVRMVKTLRNYPSIIVWSQGNEAGSGENFAIARKKMLEIDASRPIQYENGTYSKESRAATTSINCPMYSTPQQAFEFVSNNPEMPFIQCEYAHAMGNSTGGFADFWDLADRYDSFQGGYIWDWADQALFVGGALKYGGDFGDKPNNASFNCNGIVDPFRTPHPGALEVAHVHSLYPNSYPAPGEVALCKELAALEIKPFFWRAPTDNDNAAGKYLAVKHGLWRDATFEQSQENGVFEFNESLKGSTVTIRRHAMDERTLRVDVDFNLAKDLPAVPRVGVALALPASATNLVWNGRGPMENYPDRKFAAKPGLWRKDISGPVPYVTPMDYNHFCDVHALRLGNFSVEAVASSTPREGLKDTFGFAAWPYTVEQLENAMHNEELTAAQNVTLVLDAAIMGVGGDDSWGVHAAPRAPHFPESGHYTLTFVLRAE